MTGQTIAWPTIWQTSIHLVNCHRTLPENIQSPRRRSGAAMTGTFHGQRGYRRGSCGVLRPGPGRAAGRTLPAFDRDRAAGQAGNAQGKVEAGLAFATLKQ